MATRYVHVYDTKREARGHVAPEAERFKTYTYRIRHDLCAICHRRMELRAFEVC